jgi:hypothetical protein
MVCKTDIRFILVWVERLYIQCSLLLCVALHRSACSRRIQADRERDGSQVSVSGCVRVCA